MSRCVSPSVLARLGTTADGFASERRHLEGCAACRTVLGRVAAAQAALVDARELPVPEASEVRAEATLRWLRVPPTPVSRRWQWGFGFGLTLAAAAAAFVLVPRWTQKQPQVAKILVPATPSEPALVVAPKVLHALITLRAGHVERQAVGHDRGVLDERGLLDEGDVLVTSAGASVAAQWGDGSGVLLHAGSELHLSTLRPDQQVLELPSGRVDVRVKPQARTPGQPPLLTVRTPGHLVHVRGTWFAVSAQGLETSIEVYEGTVEVTERDGASSTLLHAPSRGVFGRDKHAGRARTQPMTVDEAARLRQRSELNLLAFTDLSSLLKDSGSLMVTADAPADAQVTVAVDAVALGMSPLWLRREHGRHLIELSRRGFDPVRRWVTIGDEPGDLRLGMIRSAPKIVEEQPELAVIEELLRQRRSQIRSCYERSLKHNPELAGTVTLRLHLDDSGRVSTSAVDSETLSEPAVGRCLRNEAAGWSFPGGRNATIVYPFVFRAQ